MKRIPIAGLALLAATAWPVAAQDVQGCDNLNGVEGQKIVVSCVEYTPAQGSRVVLTNAERLTLLFALQGGLDNLFERKDQPAGVLCAERRPEPDGSTYTDDYVRALDTREVLMEIWGDLHEDVENGEELFGGDLYMMVFPIRLQPLEGVDEIPDFHTLRFPPRARADVEDALRATTFGPEFSVYALLGRAVKSYRNRRWDEAQAFLSRAELTYESARSSGSLARTNTREQDVIAYMAELGSEIVAGAGADPAYGGDLPQVEKALEDEP